jgi:hypothetical protein
VPRSALVGICLLPALACRPSNAGTRDADDGAADVLGECNGSTSPCAPDATDAALNDDAEDASWACGDAGAFGADAGSGAVNWAMSFGKTGVISPGPLAIDPSTGEIAVAGTSPFGSADFGAGSVSNDCPPTPLEAGTSLLCVDLFVARFDACGRAKWAKMMGSGGTTSPVVVAAGPGGNTIVGGQLLPGASVDFGCGPLPAISGNPFFIAAFSKAGSCVFSKGFGSSNDPSLQSLTGMAVDGDGNVLLAGEMNGSSSPVDFGGGPVDGRTFIVKLGPDGSHLWSHGLQVYSEAPTLAVSGMGEAVLAATVVPEPDADRLGDGAASAHSEVALFKYDAAGNEVWSRVFDDAAGRAQIRESGVAVDALGNIALLGSFSGAAVDFGMGLLTPGVTGAAFLVALDPQGGAIWRKALQPVNAYIYPGAIASDVAGGVTITATFSSSPTDGSVASIDFGGGSLPATSSAVAHFDSTGAYSWAYAPQPSSSPGGAWATLSGVAVARTTVVIAGGIGEACPGTSICQTSPDGVTVSLPGKTVTATSATDTFLASFGL